MAHVQICVEEIGAEGKEKGVEELLPWIPAIKTHLWWSSATCSGDKVEMKGKWQSVTYHVTNEHNWGHGQTFQQCGHVAITSDKNEATKWLEPGSEAHEALNAVVLQDERLKDGVDKLNLFCHTGALENFNGSMLKYCPKRIPFCKEGMIARTKLAALDHNYNVGREQAVVNYETDASAEEGEERFDLVW